MNEYDFTPKTFNEFLKINCLDLENGIIAVVNEYSKLKAENELSKLKKEGMRENTCRQHSES